MTVQRSVELTVKLVDQVSATAKQMQSSADSAKESVVALEQAQDSVDDSIIRVRRNLDDAVVDARSMQAETSRIIEEIGGSMDGLSMDVSTDCFDGVRESIEDVVTQASSIPDRIAPAVDTAEEDLDRLTGKARSTATGVDSAVSPSIDKVEGDLDGVSSKARSTSSQVKTAMAEADESIIAVQTRQALELATLMGVKESVGSIISGVTQLGLVSDETAKDLAKVNAGFQLVAGAATGLKTLQVLMTALNTQTAINASLNTFLSVIRKPAIGSAVVGLGLGAMAGVAGMYLYTSNNSSKNVTVNVVDTASDTTKGEIFRVVNGGAV